MVIEACVSGVSTRKVEELVAAVGCESGISKSEVSRIYQGLDVQLQAFLDRPLELSPFPSSTAIRRISTAVTRGATR